MNQENISSGFVSRFIIVLICECRGVKNDNGLRGQKWPDIVTPSLIQFPSSQLGFGSISRGLNIVLLEWGNLSVVKILYYLHSCGGPKLWANDYFPAPFTHFSLDNTLQNILYKYLCESRGVYIDLLNYLCGYCFVFQGRWSSMWVVCSLCNIHGYT